MSELENNDVEKEKRPAWGCSAGFGEEGGGDKPPAGDETNDDVGDSVVRRVKERADAKARVHAKKVEPAGEGDVEERVVVKEKKAVGREKPAARASAVKSSGKPVETKVGSSEKRRRVARRGMGFSQKIGAYFFLFGVCAFVFFASQGRFKLVFQYDKGVEFVVGVLDKKNVVPEKDSWFAFSYQASDRPALATVVMFQGDRYDKLFVKKLACLPGERLNYRGAAFYCDEVLIGKGLVKDELTGKGVGLYRYAGPVPPKKFFSVGMTRHSYDSKYRGFVDGSWIVGKVYPIVWVPSFLANFLGDKLDG